ncbi:MAG: FAD-dependent oxidoreductase [Bryobacteraceae bacterium]
MPSTEQYDNLIIGSGEAGKYLAWTLASAGQRTALVERKLIGGSCPNIACLPTKNVIHSAKIVSFAHRAAEFGLEGEPLSTDMQGVRRRKREMVDGLVSIQLERFRTSGVDLVMGQAHFTGAKTVQVQLNDGGERQITGERVFLSLGTRASIPGVPGLASAQPMTHVEALELDRVAGHLIVMGGGYVGLELAQAMRRFGSRVTVIERASQLLQHDDPDVGTALLQLFKDEGLEVLLNTTVLAVEGFSGGKVSLKVEGEGGESTISGTHLLVAVGRTPNTKGVGLEETNVALDSRGYITVNERLETTAPNVWAMGDCAGSPQFTHAAFDDFRIVRDNLCGGNRTTRGRLIPSCMFTDPELVRVGLSESEARRLGIAYRLAKMPIANVLRTRTVSEPRGFMKMLLATDSDRILGFTAFGVDASELLATVQTAMLGAVPYTTLRDAIFTHPTIAEGFGALLMSPAAAPPS